MMKDDIRNEVFVGNKSKSEYIQNISFLMDYKNVSKVHIKGLGNKIGKCLDIADEYIELSDDVKITNKEKLKKDGTTGISVTISVVE